MAIDYQVVLDFIVSIMGFMAPVYIIFEICSRILNMFLDFVGGRRRIRLD